MKRTRTEKGITLVALIITIVVLLILAAVAISSIQNDGIIGKSNNAANQYNQAQQNEQGILGGYEGFLNNYGGASNGGSVEIIPVDPIVGQYVEYDVSYASVGQSGTYTYTKTNGWRYLGTDTDGSHLLVSSSVPMAFNYSSTANDASAQWWDTTQTNPNEQAAQGLIKNLANVPYTISEYGWCDENEMAGTFGNSSRTTVGDFLKVKRKTYSSSITVRVLTLADLNRAVNSAMKDVEGYTLREETSTALGFENIPKGNAAYELFFSDACFYYYLATPEAGSTTDLYVVDGDYFTTYECIYGLSGQGYGVRPVIVLPSTIQFSDVDDNGVLEIIELNPS